MTPFAIERRHAGSTTCGAACDRDAVVPLKGVPLCLTHYWAAMRGIARTNSTVRGFSGDITALAQVDELTPRPQAA